MYLLLNSTMLTEIVWYRCRQSLITFQTAEINQHWLWSDIIYLWSISRTTYRHHLCAYILRSRRSHSGNYDSKYWGGRIHASAHEPKWMFQDFVDEPGQPLRSRMAENIKSVQGSLRRRTEVHILFHWVSDYNWYGIYLIMTMSLKFQWNWMSRVM